MRQTISRTTVDTMIDGVRVLQTHVDRGAVSGADPAIQVICQEALATIDAYLAQLPLGRQRTESRELVARLQAPTAYAATVPPKRRGVVVAGKV